MVQLFSFIRNIQLQMLCILSRTSSYGFKCPFIKRSSIIGAEFWAFKINISNNHRSNFDERAGLRILIIKKTVRYAQ